MPILKPAFYNLPKTVLVYVGDSRVSAVSQSVSASNQFTSANINHPALLYSSSSSHSMNSAHRKRRSSKKQPVSFEGILLPNYVKYKIK